jgi:hypothetical protein
MIRARQPRLIPVIPRERRGVISPVGPYGRLRKAVQRSWRHCEPTGRAYARPMTGSAMQSSFLACCTMDCFASLAMTAGYNFAFSPQVRARVGLLVSPSNIEGVGNAGCQRTRSRACSVESTRVSHHGYAETPGIPARDGFNGFLRDLPGDRAFLSPSPLRSLLPKNLTPASRRQDHTTSPSAS